MYNAFDIILGAIIWAGQIMSIIKVFGGGKNWPKRLNILVGICAIIFCISFAGLAMK